MLSLILSTTLIAADAGRKTAADLIREARDRAEKAKEEKEKAIHEAQHYEDQAQNRQHAAELRAERFQQSVNIITDAVNQTFVELATEGANAVQEFEDRIKSMEALTKREKDDLIADRKKDVIQMLTIFTNTLKAAGINISQEQIDRSMQALRTPHESGN